MTFFKLFTHDFCSPLQGGKPVFDGSLPFTLPAVKLDTSAAECERGWNFVDDLAKGFQRDMIDKGRNKNPTPRPGEANPMAKLTKSQVFEIRKRYQYGNGYQLAREFGVSRMTITRAVQRQCWKEEKNDSN